ncbi:protein-glutamine gamma-glutamyltransferase E isoform X1 [Echeneis naucrates]|uniref:protein-glutamine gamma-glutamyltransferase E isoform X1 n=1 Tax=Echeneis naucrates TaxID=173247 RepID=UPI00111333AE|nr:protein-glutamine gamma-glutamyltransferase E-like isoform X1 [Echeneis naucrates]
MELDILERVDFHTMANNSKHHTSDIAGNQLIVRRGQPFTLTLHLMLPLNPDLHSLIMVAETGEFPSEDQGTKSSFAIQNFATQRSATLKAQWRAEPQSNSTPLTVAIFPPANTPIGEYRLSVQHGDKETLLGTLVVLFNPWCPDDAVFLPDESERQEFVMNEQGTIYRGSGNYITSSSWDLAQFEDDMVEICLKILNMSHKHMEDPAEDVSARCDPVYVGRVVSAMINSDDDHGILVGKWAGSFWGGVSPHHWNGSHAILRKWYDTHCFPVRYGQCWVFAGVMCSVLRLLGIPCRIITNYLSAHDTNKNLLIDVYHTDYGVWPIPSKDSVWNYHVWVEGWMRRLDLADNGKYDGWQVLDPTPQEKSDGVYCCGPAPVSAILNGDTHIKYDVPFVFAEVNADCVDWLVKADGSKVKIFSDTKRVGQNISTKSVGSTKRLDITDTYKHRDGSEKERTVFESAISNKSTDREEEGKGGMGEETEETEEETTETGEETGETGEETEEDTKETGEETEETEEETKETGEETEKESRGGEDVNPPRLPVSMQFEELFTPLNGQDLSLKLLLRSKSAISRLLSISISIQAMRYHGSPAATIQTETREETLQPGTELVVPVLVPFLAYHKHMVQSESIKVSAVVTDRLSPTHVYLAEDDIVLLDPPMSLSISGPIQLNHWAMAELVFTNPINETLKNCSITLTGSGLLKKQVESSVPDLQPNRRTRIQYFFIPYKTGLKTLIADFDCSAFRDVKTSISVNVTS